MIIGAASSLALFTKIVNSENKDMAFKWIDPIKRTGLQVHIEWNNRGGGQEVLRADGSLSSLEWTEKNPFPYDIIIRDPITKKQYTNPCEHDLVILEKNANRFREGCRIERQLEKQLMSKCTERDRAWQEANK